MTRHTFNREAFALFVHQRADHPKHLKMEEAALEAGVSKAQVWRAIHKQPVSIEAFGNLCIWIDINPLAFFLDPKTGTGLAELPPAPSRAKYTETGGSPDVSQGEAA